MMNRKASVNTDLTRRLQARQLSTLLKVSSALAASLDLNVVLQTAIESAVEVLELDTGAIYVINGDDLYLGATTPPLPENFPEEFRFAALKNHDHILKAVSDSQPVYVKNALLEPLSPEETLIVETRHLRSILYIPLLIEEKALGVLIIGTTGKVRIFKENEIDLVKVLSYQIALAVANSRLFHSVEQANIELLHAYDVTLEGWSRALEMRDEDTLGHTLRVAEMTVRLARILCLPESELEHIRRGALLHDIGKIGVPDPILKKKGNLTDDEWRLMRQHPELAYSFLKHIHFLQPALDIPFAHHEKWDGTGYPRGLSQEEIPLAARIFAVVDVYDALTSDRPYRSAWSKEEAMSYLREQAGKHFDPQLVEVFLDHIGDIKGLESQDSPCVS